MELLEHSAAVVEAWPLGLTSPQTRIRGLDLAAEGCIGAREASSTGAHWGKGARYDGKAVGTSEYPLTDALGSVVAVTDASGAVVRTNSYDVYGERTSSTGTGPQLAFGFTGREHDATGLNYHRDRYMDPKLGRWGQPDRLGMLGGFNPYLYAAASPTLWTDASGFVPGQIFSTAEEAAYDALKYIKPMVDADRVEYAGWIYGGLNGFTYDMPAKGVPGGADPPPRPVTSCGVRVVAVFHGHPYFPPAMGGNSERFTVRDEAFAEDHGVVSYLVTPSGAIRVYIPEGRGLSATERISIAFGGSLLRAAMHLDYGTPLSGHVFYDGGWP